MEIIGIGTDIVECLRIGRMIEAHGEVFLRRVYTEREVRYCQARRRATEHFAAYWAAKEAVFKALGTAWRRDLSWTDIEVSPEVSGRLNVVLSGAARDLAQRLHVAEVLLSACHCRAYATAYALAVPRHAVSPLLTRRAEKAVQQHAEDHQC
jgi:holo-[acyl-carrier protein] synthase